MNNIAICSVTNKILVETVDHNRPECPVRYVIICRDIITYLTARQFAMKPIFYQYQIPNGIINRNS